MIDFTELQTIPVPPDIISLQKVNTNLQGENKAFRNILICLAIGGIVFIGYKIYRSIEENEKKIKK